MIPLSTKLSCYRQIHNQIYLPCMGITPHNRISTKSQKCRVLSPRGCRTILNKREGVMLYQNTCDLWMLIPRPLSTFSKQSGPTVFTPPRFSWLLPAQYFTHDLSNAKQMDNKTNPYWKDRPGRSLMPDTCKRDRCVNMHCNSRQVSLSLTEVTICYHTCTSIIYDC